MQPNSATLFALAALLGCGAGAAQTLSDRMPLAGIERALERYPPRWEFGAERALILASLDRQVTVQIRKGWTGEERASLRPLHEFYLRRVDAGLEKLERTRVTEGVQVFKFYSSSFVLRSAQGTVAIDFCQGPINNGGEPETRDEYGSGFYWTPAQRDRLAAQVDVSLITHRHHDHADYSLARRMTRVGKPVIGPAQLKTLWKEFAAALTVPRYGERERFGPVEILTSLGSQYASNRPTGNGTEREGVPSPEPDRDSETVLYLFRLGGIAFLACGENQTPSGGWLREAMENGWRPDALMSLGQFQGERSLIEALRPAGRFFRLPRHEYEMMHGGGGNRLGTQMTGSNRAAFDRREAMPMAWGEDFHLSEAAVSRLR